MASTGYTACGAGASIAGGDNSWSNPGNITGDDFSNASTSHGSGGKTSDWLEADQFGFALPAGATIDGIEVQADWWYNDSIASYEIQLVENSTLLGTAKTTPSLPASQSRTTWGGASDTWGASLTEAIVESASFGVRMRQTTSGGGAKLFENDYVQMNVHYTEAASGAPKQMMHTMRMRNQ
ncbi:MAG: hypothetical protein ACYTF7_11330 [Planctomycetota bacterium]|jgi:hypothetical protein